MSDDGGRAGRDGPSSPAVSRGQQHVTDVGQVGHQLTLLGDGVLQLVVISHQQGQNIPRLGPLSQGQAGDSSQNLSAKLLLIKVDDAEVLVVPQMDAGGRQDECVQEEAVQTPDVLQEGQETQRQ